jgi:hypothetical protein
MSATQNATRGCGVSTAPRFIFRTGPLGNGSSSRILPSELGSHADWDDPVSNERHQGISAAVERTRQRDTEASAIECMIQKQSP